MTFEPTITLGQALPWIMAFAGLIGAAVLGWFVNQVKKALLVEWEKMVAAFKLSTEETIGDSEKKLGDQLADTNRRVSDLAAGVSATQTEFKEFRTHVDRRYVEKDEIAALQTSFEKSIDRMEGKIDNAAASMGDVRDEVIKLTASLGKGNVPPARRRTTKPA